MKKVLCGLIFIAVAACQIQTYPQMLHGWLGKSEAELVETWGAPADMQTIAPGKQIFVYVSERQTYLPGEVPDTPFDESLAYNEYGEVMGQTFTYFCTTTFTTKNDIIVDYSFEGDGCLME